MGGGSGGGTGKLQLMVTGDRGAGMPHVGTGIMGITSVSVGAGGETTAGTSYTNVFWFSAGKGVVAPV